jgi:DNA-binding response OmpR family regulator
VGSILVVQTDPAEQLAAAIEAAGHSVQVVYSPREALPIARDGGIDVVVIDAYDPRVRIPELAKQIDALPDAPPIVLVSSSPHAPEISARIGATAFLPKPCEPSELVALVDRLVTQNRPVRRVEG